MNIYILLAAVGIAIGAIVGAYMKGESSGIAFADKKWLVKYAALETEKNAKIEAATDRYITGEASNLVKTQAAEQKSNELEKKLLGVRLANGRLVDATCGLFDRNGRPAGGGGGDAPGVAACGALSAQGIPANCNIPNEVLAAVREFGNAVADLLLEADHAAATGIAGHDYALEVEAFRAKHAGGRVQ